MNIHTYSAFLAIAAAAIAVPASAQDVGDVTVSAGLSTFGANLEAAYQITPEFRIRGALMGGLSYSETSIEDGNEYDIDASLGAFAVLADYYPTSSGFRVSGGLLFNATSIDATTTASAASPIEIDDTTYDSGTLSASAEFAKSVAPMVTAGYDLRFGSTWSIGGEIGAVYTGGIDLTAKGSTPQLQNAIDGSADYRDARDDASDVTFYPYLAVTVSYRF